jgi:DNA-directed RNA polymerase subunit N (RpoN/RPB10)
MAALNELPLWPVRCITCGLVLAGWRRNLYYQLLREGKSPQEAMNQIGVHRECCRARVSSLPQEPPGYLVPTIEEEAAARVLQAQEEERLTQPPTSQPAQGVLQGMQSNSRSTQIRAPRYAMTRLLAPRTTAVAKGLGRTPSAVPSGTAPGSAAAMAAASVFLPEAPSGAAPKGGSQPIIHRRFRAI